MTREDKIKAIQRLIKGHRLMGDFIEDITGFVMIWEGEYTDMKTGRIMSEDEYNSLTKPNDEP